jgi:hypothetical protein
LGKYSVRYGRRIPSQFHFLRTKFESCKTRQYLTEPPILIDWLQLRMQTTIAPISRQAINAWLADGVSTEASANRAGLTSGS